jgi:hypothetical protein
VRIVVAQPRGLGTGIFTGSSEVMAFRAIRNGL